VTFEIPPARILNFTARRTARANDSFARTNAHERMTMSSGTKDNNVWRWLAIEYTRARERNARRWMMESSANASEEFHLAL